MQIIRADSYQSWLYESKGTLVAVDPWLNKKQEFPLFSWLLYRESGEDSYLIKNNLISRVTHIVITAHFSDHLDLNSLKLFKKNIPIYTTKEASKVLSKNGFINVSIVNVDSKYQLGEFQLEPKLAGKPYHKTSFAYVISHNLTRVIHEPHIVNSNHILKNINAAILTVDRVRVLGLVEVSMSMNKASSRSKEMDASYILPTGISPSSTKGLIAWILSINEHALNLSGDLLACRKMGDSLTL